MYTTEDDVHEIRTLPSDTRARLRSTQILTSLPQLISELVQNSLDARASHVDIGLDFDDWSCWVRDDGVGMAIGMDGLGCVGGEADEGRYGTSKTYGSSSINTPSTFGFRGEALASAANLSCLEISSRTVGQNESWSVILKGGKRLYYGAALRWRRERPGTVVCIRDAFYNLPIRRLSHPNASRTMELVIKELQTFALVFPQVAFSFEDTSKSSKDSATKKTRVLSVPKVIGPPFLCRMSSELYVFYSDYFHPTRFPSNIRTRSR